MKRFIIFFIIMVSIMTSCLTRSTKIDEGNVVTEEEIAQYKQSLLDASDKYGYYLTEEEINEMVQSHIETEINIANSKAGGMDFKKALKTSLIACSICCIVLFLIFHLKNAHYNELFGNDNENDSFRGLRRFFFGKWF